MNEEKVELLRKVDIFSQLAEYELDTIAEYSEYVKLKKGAAVFSNGAESNELYVVDRGRIGIIGFETDGDAMIAQIVEGESFGELDFLGRTPRNAGAFAEEDSMLLCFPGKSFKADEVFLKHPVIFARMLYKLLATISCRIWNVNKMLYGKTGWLLDLHKQLLSDKMTGLYNQTFLKEDFMNMLPDIGKSVSLIMIKPDNFKEINDIYGHVAGDQVLNLMAIFLQSELGEDDIGVRYRGDEYAAILIDTDRDEAVAKAAEIRKAFREMDISRITGSGKLVITTSIGIAVYPDDADNSSDLVTIAYDRMYAARKSGNITLAQNGTP
ncbi:MAG TPA: GGDEF domain-containing protein [Spirochaetota bacterium]|nr:GGDEF domain-containing protein [Spirochaetota bacterium]